MQILNDQNNTEQKYKKPFEYPTSNFYREIPYVLKLILFAVGWIGIQFLAFLIFTILNLTPMYDYETGVLSPTGQSVGEFLTYFLLLIIFIAIFVFNKRKLYRWIPKEFAGKKTYLTALVAFSAIIVTNIIFNLIFSLVPFYQENINQQNVTSIIQEAPILSFFTIVIFGPICEEITYRLGLMDALRKKGNLFGIVISAVVFGLIHFNFNSIFTVMFEPTQANIEQMAIELMNLPTYMVSGFILGFAYGYSGKISSPLLAHFVNNLYSYIAVLAL